VNTKVLEKHAVFSIRAEMSGLRNWFGYKGRSQARWLLRSWRKVKEMEPDMGQQEFWIGKQKF
jgi:hypothetical protein